MVVAEAPKLEMPSCELRDSISANKSSNLADSSNGRRYDSSALISLSSIADGICFCMANVRFGTLHELSFTITR